MNKNISMMSMHDFCVFLNYFGFFLVDLVYFGRFNLYCLIKSNHLVCLGFCFVRC
ncbi:hypothetical protein Syun_011293 [Stephania yunnanensis]|uniref:Uncharacterized protein n=1 Tax=Stephania yunnanensis TaxID=152371 RepID=A0AAP0PEA0_9MAGN